MKEISCQAITETVARLCLEANLRLPPATEALIHQAAEGEPYPPARESLRLIERNLATAAQTGVPICQDTGTAVVFAELGQDARITGGLLEDAVNAGVARGYTEHYLRKSIVGDPLRRINTGDNTPAALHLRLTAGDSLKLTVAPKGCGSENMSRLAMLTPAAGAEGVKDFIVETVRLAGANPCPPVMVGVGIGGTFDGVALLAKQALALPREGDHPDPYYAAMEKELLERINALGIGPGGYGGKTTALAVRILTAPTHIAGLPVAVNLGCHVTRSATAVL